MSYKCWKCWWCGRYTAEWEWTYWLSAGNRFLLWNLDFCATGAGPGCRWWCISFCSPVIGLQGIFSTVAAVFTWGGMAIITVVLLELLADPLKVFRGSENLVKFRRGIVYIPIQRS